MHFLTLAATVPCFLEPDFWTALQHCRPSTSRTRRMTSKCFATRQQGAGSPEWPRLFGLAQIKGCAYARNYKKQAFCEKSRRSSRLGEAGPGSEGQSGGCQTVSQILETKKVPKISPSRLSPETRMLCPSDQAQRRWLQSHTAKHTHFSIFALS
jgi:hypothetical protein